MRNRAIQILALVMAVLIVVLAVLTRAGAHHTAVQPEPDFQAPQISLTSTTGVALNLSQYRGKLVYVNFWASWCPPCQAETPDLVRMYHKYGKQIVFIGVNLTGNDTAKAAGKFIQTYHIPYPVLLDPSNVAATNYNIIAIPVSLFIDRQGIIVSRVTGGMTKQVMQQHFNQLLRHT